MKTVTLVQHYLLHQLSEGLFVKEVKLSRRKSNYFVSGNGVDTYLNQLTFVKLIGMRMIKGDNNPANINQHYILSERGERYIKQNPF